MTSQHYNLYLQLLQFWNSTATEAVITLGHMNLSRKFWNFHIFTLLGAFPRETHISFDWKCWLTSIFQLLMWGIPEFREQNIILHSYNLLLLKLIILSMSIVTVSLVQFNECNWQIPIFHNLENAQPTDQFHLNFSRVLCK